MKSLQERKSHASDQYSYANAKHKFNWREAKVRTIKYFELVDPYEKEDEEFYLCVRSTYFQIRFANR